MHLRANGLDFIIGLAVTTTTQATSGFKLRKRAQYRRGVTHY